MVVQKKTGKNNSHLIASRICEKKKKKKKQL